MRQLVTAFALASLAVPASAGASGSAQNFLDRVDRLKAKGPMALFDGDLKRLKAEARAAGKSISDERVAMEQRGRKPLYCSPKPRAALGQDEFLRGLEAIPAAERQRLTLRSAMLRIVQRKYPCPA